MLQTRIVTSGEVPWFQEAANQVKTKQRSMKEWVKLLYTIFKAKRAARRAAKDAKRDEEARQAARKTSGPIPT